ncbi:nuclear pore complex protein Nup214 isoform X2 [Zootermopsis nevadensis]|uniref:nuclear pore complex protein Nup214 isoform X2 n=1 Tax=Zootermopsis nevadensis TaxID=136037 RepID=UPI000B8ECC2D|nr:nuclear pore complex protein Nup214 isoform X2 [Zootermopsis nevadensis]
MDVFAAYSSSDLMHSNARSNSRSQQLLHQTPSRYSGDVSFSPKGSPWGKSVSPKLRTHGAGIKTVQTVAGPLLASTRFNINKNLRMFGNVSSPGLSSRVAHYASEDAKILTHQKQYSGPGQFPLVNLDHSASKLPVHFPRRDQRIVHSPVTVSIARPQSSDMRYMSKSQNLSGSSLEEQDSSKSVLEVLKEISRKRIHAQLDENEDDTVKRQRKGDGQIIADHGSIKQQLQDDMALGKRAREESPNQNETSPHPLQQQNKRTRNNEISSSLSSSRNLLNQLKTSTKRKSSTSDWSRSSTPVMSKPPKQSRDSLEDAANIIRGTPVPVLTSPIQTPATTPTLSIDKADETSTEKSVDIKPSKFLPKFAAVLDKNGGPVLNSVAALETKRAYDSRTRLRSMLAVIAGEDDFIRKPSSTANDVTASSATATTTFSSILPPVSAAGDVRETTTAPSNTQTEPVLTDTNTQASAAKNPYLPNSVSLMIPNNISPVVTNISVANTGFGLESVTSTPVTSLLNQTAPNLTLTSSPASTFVFAEEKKPTSTLTTSTYMVAPTEQKIDPFKNVATTSSSGTSFIFGKPQSSQVLTESSNSLPKMSAEDAPQLVTSSTPDLGMSNGSSTAPSSNEQAGHGSASDSSNASGGFSSSSVNTVISVAKPLVTETTKSLFSFGNMAASPSVNTTTCASATTTSNSLLKSAVNCTQADVGQYGSLATSAATSGSISTDVTLFGSAKSDDKPSTALPVGTQNFGIKPETSRGILFQLNATNNSTAINSFGGFKFDFTKGLKENEVASTTQSQPTVNLMTSSTAPITTTSAITSISTPTTTSFNISTPASTSQSQESPLKFGTTFSTPLFNFGGTSTASGPTQSVGGFPGCIFGNSQPKTDGVTQKPQQSPFTFGTVPSSQNQSLTSTFTFGGSSALSGVKSGGFAFGGGGGSQSAGGIFGSGNAPGQSAQSGIGNVPDQASLPGFGGGNKTDQSQSGVGIFGTAQSSDKVFAGTQVLQPSGLFGSSVTQSSGIFGSTGNVSTPSVQSSGAIFGSSGSLSVQSPQQTSQPSSGIFGTPSQPSGGIFGSGSSVVAQPAGGAFGGGSSTQPVFGFGSTSATTPAQQTASGGSTGLFGATASFQFGAGSSSAATSAPQSTGGFSFGSSGVNPSAAVINFSTETSGNTAFQFGSGAAPVFGNQTMAPGRFSIGSGSTAPRARTARLRRQR